MSAGAGLGAGEKCWEFVYTNLAMEYWSSSDSKKVTQRHPGPDKVPRQ